MLLSDATPWRSMTRSGCLTNKLEEVSRVLVFCRHHVRGEAEFDVLLGIIHERINHYRIASVYNRQCDKRMVQQLALRKSERDIGQSAENMNVREACT